MKMNMAFIFLLSTVCSPICPPVQAANKNINLVENSSFEFMYTTNTYGKIPTYWSRVYGGTGSLDISTTNMHGARSFKLIDSATNSAVGVQSDLMPVTKGYAYSARCWARRDAAPMVPTMHLRFYDAASNMVYGPSVSIGTTSGTFTEHQLSATAPTNAVSARIFLYSNNASTGNVCVDCVSLTLTDEMINDGAFSAAAIGQFPVHWSSVGYTNTGAIQDVQSDGGNLVLRIYDNTNSKAIGAWYNFPASSGVPYKLSASARNVTGNPYVYMKFFDSSNNQLASYYTYTSSTNYTALTVAQIAPSNTAYGKMLCCISQSGTGTAYYDDISVTENYTLRYAAPAAVGSGAGTNSSTAACYTNGTFWSAVNSAAASAPVKVVLLSGCYNIGNLRFDGIGNTTNTIIIEGEKPFRTLFDGLYGARFFRTKNMILRNVHFHAPASGNGAVAVGDASAETKDITIEGCSFYGMTNVTYGVCSMTYGTTHDITLQECDFVRCGKPSDGSHMIYNSQNAYAIKIINNYLEDGWGSYLKIRSGSSGYIIIGNRFVQNNGYYTTYSKPFMQFYANNTSPADEVLGTDYLVENNTFDYKTAYTNHPMQIYILGETPTNHPGYHEVDSTEKSTIENTGGSVSSRNAEILENFGVNITNDWIIGNNIYSNASPIRLELYLSPAPTGFQDVCADIDALIGDD